MSAIAPAHKGGVISGAADLLAATLLAERSRWFLWLPVLMGGGIALYFSLSSEPSGLTAVAIVVIAVTLRYLCREGLAGPLISAALLALTAGFCLAKLRTERATAPILERALYSADVHGIVELIEPRPERGERLTLRVTSIAGIEAGKTPARVRIRAMVAAPGLKPGDAVRLKAKIGPPSAPSLPGDFDFARAAYFQGIGATGYALAKAEIEVVPASVAARSPTLAVRSSVLVEALRQKIGERVVAALPGERGAIATALITGARGAITEKTNAAFRDSGLFHILSISGLHMVIMAGAAFFGVRHFLALFPTIALAYPVKKWAAGAALIAAFAYLTISGSSVATVRSAVMVAIMFLAVLLDRPALAMRNVALAALLILAVSPESLLDAGFQMSFAAVISLIAVYEVLRARTELQERLQMSAIRKTGAFFGGIILSTLIASFSVAPLAAYHFHKTQQFAVVANLIAIPVCNLIVMPAGLLTMLAMPFGLEALPLTIMGIGIDIMLWVATWVATLPGAVGHIQAIPFASLILMISGGLWLTLWETKWRLGGLILAALGAMVLPLQSRGDILAGRDGALVAVRQSDGTLAAMPGRQAGFELKRWLESDGDARTPAEAAVNTAWRCDQAGCVATIKGVVVAAVRHPSALPEDCARARVLVLPFPAPKGCAGPEIIIDQQKFWSGGTHVILIDEVGAVGTAAAGALQPSVRLETVASRRGDRPWTAALREHPPNKTRDAKISTASAPLQQTPEDDDE